MTGSLLVPGLEHLRRSFVADGGRPPDALAPSMFEVLRAVLDSLGVGLEPTLSFLARRLPSAQEFEAWVIEQHGGVPDPDRLARANRLAGGLPPTPAEADWHAALEREPPALSGSDLAFWEEHGYVILPGAAPEAARAALERALWEHLGAEPDDPASWSVADLQQGIMVQLFRAPGIAEIHGSRRIQKAFAQLLGTTDLVMSADRLGFNPPVASSEQWTGARMHLDLDDFAPPIPLRVQGILYLTDTRPDQGAFRCIPGFHRRIDDWVRGLGGRDPNAEDFEALGPVSVGAGAGDLVIWHSALPHGSQPNLADRPRLVHYLTMYAVPAPDEENEL